MVFVSVARHVAPVSLEQLTEIARAMWRIQAKWRLTGELRFDGQLFHQTIEGEADIVTELAAEILADPNYADITIQRYEAIDQRLFTEFHLSGFEDVVTPCDLAVQDEDTNLVRVDFAAGRGRSGSFRAL